MQPVSGPFNEIVDEPGTTARYREKLWWRQKPPYNIPLPYRAQKLAASYKEGGINYPVDAISLSPLPGSFQEHLMSVAQAKAYDSFNRKAKNSAALAVSLAEGKQSIFMVAQRAGQLLSAVKALKKGDISSFRRNLGLTGRPATRKEKKALAQNPSGVWLEYTFGWVPLIEDIGSAVEVLQQDFNPFPIRGRGAAIDSKETRTGDYGLTRLECTAKAEHRGAIHVTNPNLFLANQLGFVNPLTVAWELIPFSFVVDWFVPVGKFVSSLTNTVGLEVIQANSTYKLFASRVEVQTYPPPNDIYNREIISTGSSIRREVGDFPLPSLFSRAHFPTADAWLAATSLALLVQQLKSLR